MGVRGRGLGATPCSTVNKLCGLGLVTLLFWASAPNLPEPERFPRVLLVLIFTEWLLRFPSDYFCKGGVLSRNFPGNSDIQGSCLEYVPDFPCHVGYLRSKQTVIEPMGLALC